MVVLECHRWALLLLLVSLFDSLFTLAVLESGVAEEAGPVSLFLLKMGGVGLFFSGRTFLVVALFFILETGLTRGVIPDRRCTLFYRVAVTAYLSLYAASLLVINVKST